MLSVDKHCGKSQILQTPCAISNQEATNIKETFSSGRIIYSPWLPGIFSLYSAATFFKDTVPTSRIHGSHMCDCLCCRLACILQHVFYVMDRGLHICLYGKEGTMTCPLDQQHSQHSFNSCIKHLLCSSWDAFLLAVKGLSMCVVDLLCYCVFDFVWLYNGMGIVCKWGDDWTLANPTMHACTVPLLWQQCVHTCTSPSK